MIESSCISDSCLKIVISYAATTMGEFLVQRYEAGVFRKKYTFFFGACLKIRRNVKYG